MEGLWGRPGAGAIAPVRGIAAAAGWYRRDEAIMGTEVRAELWAEDRLQGEAALDAVMQEMHRIDRTMSPHKPDSELSRINRQAGTRAVRLSDEMFALLARAIEFSRWSDGAFDISYAAVGQLYDYRNGTRPEDAERVRACAAVGWQHLILDPRERTLRFDLPGMRIDLGGFAKGHAVDNAVAILRAHGIEHAMVAAGGDSHLLGDRRGRPWTLAVRDPRREGEAAALLPLENVAVSTSGDYERYFIGGDGRRHHHLLDPRTGDSPRAVRSVTVIAGDGLTTEALSKTVFVLGALRGLRLIDSLPGVDAVVVDAAGVLHASNDLLDGGEIHAAAGHA
ncbi:MAG TPA: FAD:protein FMN transferase [Methylibium sp.]|nr:FAD:protein FMN transferase [Methylibium sp.]